MADNPNSIKQFDQYVEPQTLDDITLQDVFRFLRFMHRTQVRIETRLCALADSVKVDVGQQGDK